MTTPTSIETDPGEVAVLPKATRPSKRRVRHPLLMWAVGIGVVLAVVLLILPWLYPTSPTALAVGLPLEPPSRAHPMGTDQLGRDVASRVLHGARISLTVSAAVAGLSLVLGSVLGALAAMGPRWLSEVIMRVVDIGLAFPGILLAIVLAAVLGPSLMTTVIVLTAVFTPSMARVVRAAVYTERGEDYVTSAVLIGTSMRRLIAFHISINAAAPVLAYTTMVMAYAILGEAALSFLGAGIKPPEPSWGNIIRDGHAIVQAGAWWVSLFPGLAIVGCALALNRFADALGRHLAVR
jgi:ABC-type dipeptide/oligopeptide/nickel transport system permease subunit